MNKKKGKTVIYNLQQLKDDIEVYKEMFPHTYTDLNTIIEQVPKDLCGNNSISGYSVSQEWPDKCYLFKSQTSKDGTIEFRYIGIGKI